MNALIISHTCCELLHCITEPHNPEFEKLSMKLLPKPMLTSPAVKRQMGSNYIYQSTNKSI